MVEGDIFPVYQASIFVLFPPTPFFTQLWVITIELRLLPIFWKIKFLKGILEWSKC